MLRSDQFSLDVTGLTDTMRSLGAVIMDVWSGLKPDETKCEYYVRLWRETLERIRYENAKAVEQKKEPENVQAVGVDDAS